MKKIILMVAVVAMSASAYAKGKPYGSAGCGLGSLIFDDKHSLVSQVLASTTNGSSGSQTFGITSGTSNCTDEGTVADNRVIPLFVEANQTALAKDVARGEGETLSTLSSVMGCSDSTRVGTILQKNYERIFPSSSVGATDVTNTIVNVIKSDAELAQSCKSVG